MKSSLSASVVCKGSEIPGLLAQSRVPQSAPHPAGHRQHFYVHRDHLDIVTTGSAPGLG